MRAIVLINICIFLTACNNSKNSVETSEVSPQIITSISHQVLQEQVSCGEKKYSFSIPYFTSKTGVEKTLNDNISSLISKDFVDITYQKDTPLNSIYDMFINRRERVLCKENKNEGFTDFKTVFVSDTKKFVSYEIEFTHNKSKGKVLKTYQKPSMKELKLADLIPTNKEYEVKTIFNANLKQAIANLVTNISSRDLQERYIDYVRNTDFEFDPQDFKTCGLSFQFDTESSKNLRLAKEVELPRDFEFLNNTIVIEIDVFQLTHYLDLSSIIE